ncbi:pyridoxamine 5'-phosphate oxidase family protein [Actinoalloteichus hymeniacidonis]|uniref:Pyridoxamine 5'-phosphate oxidase n=1 Tax=Actinoalloteichus hymeniacidonis TaxID=340345 RepID=A0AAC9MY21_9PSEU|nr:pyridoxamine 5'-phosphate oxidase family protein [Actinoalloteichus hymeniacidonis]AOS62969.1 Pyridoxamine 5'-phosphate oxidase [Actinoalloteichus hymeniacidonis]MBB5908996.1 nitroimidazol reductase NimA-like FMN-containing flavoprotein (pyridoxamine 5'-phosphate oxidase superfamily) [Actinoalloteichus hymeniacidonis]
MASQSLWSVMSIDQREAYLAEAHVAILAIGREGRGPLAVPIWYGYQPGGEVTIRMNRGSTKHRAIEAAGWFSLATQTVTLPYRFVTVEGPVVGIDTPSRQQALEIAERYLPADQAVSFVDTTLNDQSVLVRMRPEKWLSQAQNPGVSPW